MNTHLWTPPIAQISVKFHPQNLWKHQSRLFAALPSLAPRSIAKLFFFFLVSLFRKRPIYGVCPRVDKMQQHKANANTQTHWHSQITNKIGQQKVTGDLLQANSVFRVTSGQCGYCNIILQTKLNKPHIYGKKKKKTFTEANRWGLAARFSQLLPILPVILASHSSASNVFYAWLRHSVDYLSHRFDIKARRIPLCAYCKTNDSDQVFMSVNAFEILLVFMNSRCAVGIQKRLWLLRRTAPWEPPWFKCQHDLRTLVWERLRVKRQANMSQWRISPSGPKCTMEQRALVCTHTHSEAYSTFFPPPKGGKAHKQCGALSSLLKMKVLQKRQPQLSNDSTGKPVYQFTEMMRGKNRCETLTWASPLTFRACQRLHLY